jgi:hypothetical protein
LPAPIEFNDYISPACLTNADISVAVGEKAVGIYFYFSKYWGNSFKLFLKN